MSRTLWGVLGLLVALVSLSGAARDSAATSGAMAMIPLYNADQVWVKDNGAWLGWTAGAPDFVNRPFLEEYGATPQAPTPAPAPPPADPVKLDWWSIGSSSATLIADDPGNDDFKLTISCSPDLAVSVQFDGGRKIPPSLFFQGHLAPAGTRGVSVQVMSDVGGQRRYQSRRESWNLTPDHGTAYAPDPAALIAHLRGGHSININGGTGFQGRAPLRPLAVVLAGLPCVEP